MAWSNVPCDARADETVVAFSYKGCGFCPSGGLAG
jgi:hypothetical protein